MLCSAALRVDPRAVILNPRRAPWPNFSHVSHASRPEHFTDSPRPTFRPHPSQIWLLALCLLAAGCGRENKTFVLATATGPKTFNSMFALDGSSDAIVRLINGALINMDMTTHEPKPGLAESWFVAPDQKTWTFKLRKGTRWSDGRPLTSADVVFTWNAIMYNPQYNRLTYDLFRIEGKPFTVTNLDEFTLQVVTPEVFAPFLEFFGSVPVLPKHALEASVKDNRFQAAYGLNVPPDRIVSCGPFCVKEFKAGQFTLLRRNPYYWVTDQQGRQLPYLDEVKILICGKPEAEADFFLQGKCDACDSVRPEYFERFKQAAARGNISLLELGVGAERDFFWFNQNTGADASGKPFVDPRPTYLRLPLHRESQVEQSQHPALQLRSGPSPLTVGGDRHPGPQGQRRGRGCRGPPH